MTGEARELTNFPRPDPANWDEFRPAEVAEKLASLDTFDARVGA